MIGWIKAKLSWGTRKRLDELIKEVREIQRELRSHAIIQEQVIRCKTCKCLLMRSNAHETACTKPNPYFIAGLPSTVNRFIIQRSFYCQTCKPVDREAK